MKRNSQSGVASPGPKTGDNANRPARFGARLCEPQHARKPAGLVNFNSQRPVVAAAGRRPALRSQSGVALVITLILLSVITFMAVTFLVMSRRGSEQTNTFTDQTAARMAADAALEHFNSQFIASIIARDNGFDFGLMVSTNYQSPVFTNGSASIANVNYVNSAGVFLPTIGGTNYEQMLANQLVLPRPPVFIVTNKVTGATDFRFWLDLNRNGFYDPSGSVLIGTNRQTVVGDPEWIGILEHPDQPHSSSNRYVARYCFIALPVGNSLDFNAIHNQAKQLGTNAGQDSFLRNEGVGSWEINLAGFLAALAPNMWNANALPYNYDTNPVSSSGLAFSDAASIVQYRYNGTYNNLGSFSGLYGALPTFFNQIGLDGYSVGPLMTSFSLPAPNEIASAPGWSGADNPNHFFTSQDYFTVLAGPNNFATHLRAAGNADRYLYYQMLSQIGVDSAPEDTNKLNLNYINVGGIAATNLIPWSALTNGLIGGTPVANLFPGATISDGALAFFTNAADRLLQSQPDLADLSSANIPIYPFNRYTPAVQRMLQLAANIYDATHSASNGIDYPSVFRPTFGVSVNGGFTNIYINGYEEVPSLGVVPATSPYLNIPMVLSPANLAALSGTIHTNIYGVPWVIGAKRGFPNFNQFAMQGTYSLTRKVQIVKDPANPTAHSLYHTNIQYGLSISNHVAVEAWNSYATNYALATTILGADVMSLYLTNGAGQVLTNFATNITYASGPSGWPGFPLNPNAPASVVAQSFIVPLNTNIPFLPGAVFHPNGTFTLTTNFDSVPFDTTTGYPQPAFDLNVTNRLRFIMVDSLTGRVIDYVQLDGMTSQQDLMAGLKGNDDFGDGGVWDTNRVDGTTNNNSPIWGVQNQVQVSMQSPPYTASEGTAASSPPLTFTDWQNAGAGSLSQVRQATTAFNQFYNNSGNNQALTAQVPYTPTRTVSVYYDWQANDPLVHYTLPDLTGIGDFSTAPISNYDKSITDQVTPNLSKVNKRYLTWGAIGARNPGPQAVNYEYNLALMDPQITRSDNWQFPTNAFPNIGWLGRVHRGTPWQTVYMKSPPVDHGLWANWTGNALSNYFGANGFYDDSADAQPINDRAIFDLFTTAPNDNATRGQLSINQTNFPAWAAVLDGVITMTNVDPVNGIYSNLVIDPNANAAALVQIVSDLNAEKTNYQGNVWVRLGDVLSTPSLTVNSPFLNTNDPTGGPAGPNLPNDFAYERIPQQIMSLLRVGEPRYVVYAYGQSLKPAANSLVTSGPFFQMCTNYQITGEVVTRTVVRFVPSGPLKPGATSTPFNPTLNPAMVGQKFGTGRNDQPNPRAVIESFTVLPPE